MKELPYIPPFQRKALAKKLGEKHWGVFVDYLCSLDKKDLSLFLNVLFSEGKKKDILKTFIGLKRITEHNTYYEIHDETGLSHQTISLLKKGLQNLDYKSYSEIFGSSTERAQIKMVDRIAKKDKAPEPKKYRKTKYGKVRSHL